MSIGCAPRSSPSLPPPLRGHRARDRLPFSTPRELPRLRLRLLTRVALALAAVGLLPVAIAALGLLEVNRDALFEQVTRTPWRRGRRRPGRRSSPPSSPGPGRRRQPGARRSPLAGGAGLLASLAAWGDLDIEAVAVVNEQGEEVVRAQLKGATPAVAEAGGSQPRTIRWRSPPEAAPSIRVVPLPGGRALRLVCGGAALADVAHPVELGEQAEIVVAARGRQVVLGSARALAGFPRSLVENALSGRLSGAGRFRTARAARSSRPTRPWPGATGRSCPASRPGGRGRGRQAPPPRGPRRGRGARAHRRLLGRGVRRSGPPPARAGRGAAGPGEGRHRPRRETRSPTSAGPSTPCGGASSTGARWPTSSSAATRCWRCWGPGGWARSSRLGPEASAPRGLEDRAPGWDSAPGSGGRESRAAARSRDRGPLQPPQRGDRLRSGGFPRGRLRRHGARRGIEPGAPSLQRDRSGRRACPARSGHGPGARRGPRPGGRPPRRQTGQRPLGKDGSIKVADFGISGLVAASAAEEKDIFFGTPGYLPPECLRGSRPRPLRRPLRLGRPCSTSA